MPLGNTGTEAGRLSDTASLAERVQGGERRALARVISLIENGDPSVRSVMKELTPLARGSRIIGLTGPPGAGKSTVTGALIKAFRSQDLTVAVLAVDPSSPFSGGALLGDRVRMADHATDPGTYIRSMASRGQLGGLAAATPQAVRALDCAGFDVILIETVGVGQAEVEIASAADSTLLLCVPGMGDSIQAAKAGVLEIADVLVVNKADRPDTQATVRDLRNMVALSNAEWKPPIVTTTGTTGEGVDELVRQLDRHWDWLGTSGERDRRRLARARDEVTALAFGAVRDRLVMTDDLAARVVAGELSPHDAAAELLASSGL